MSCSICNHPQRRAIDQALIAGSATLAALGHQYNLSTSALHRHKAHLKAKVSRAQNQLQENLRQGCIFWLSQALEMAMQVAKVAQAEGNSNLILRALAQGTRLANIILKQELNLDDRIIFEILANPQWASQDSLLPAAPDLMSLGRQSLAATLSSPCPETAADASSPATPEELALIQQFLQIMGAESAPPASTANRQPNTENRFSKRENTGKKAKKNLPLKDNSQENQEDILWKKIAGMKDFSSLAGPHPRLDTMFETIGPIPKDKPLSEYIYEQSLKGHQTAHNPGNGKGGSPKAI